MDVLGVVRQSVLFQGYFVKSQIFYVPLLFNKLWTIDFK